MNKWLLVSLTLCISGCTTQRTMLAPTSAAAVGEVRPGIVKGYLNSADLPDSLALLPVPPAAGSAAQAADDAAYHELTQFQGTARGTLAASDADLSFPHAAQTFSCALGVPISEQDTPNVNMLLRRSLTDAGLATYKAKIQYHRTRPFVVFKVPSCTPADDAMLAKDGSYPSGHTSAGWAWALILTEVAPDRANALLARGRAFGQSRGICGVHWMSDIDMGRVVGAATVARLNSDPVFIAQVKAAAAEVATLRARGAVPADCAAEAAALEPSRLIAP